MYSTAQLSYPGASSSIEPAGVGLCRQSIARVEAATLHDSLCDSSIRDPLGIDEAKASIDKSQSERRVRYPARAQTFSLRCTQS